MHAPSGDIPTQTGAGSGVVVPIRAFTDGMARLAEVLSPVQRAALGRDLADRVADAAGAHPTIVVTSAPEVQEWAAGRGLATIDDPGSLDAAAAAGVAWCAERGLTRAIVLHADLPRVTTASIDTLARDAGSAVAAIAPCRRGDGTPAMSIPVTPSGAPFAFAYGPGSYRRHAAAARAAGLGVRCVRDPALAADLDVPADLEAEGLIPLPMPEEARR